MIGGCVAICLLASAAEGTGAEGAGAAPRVDFTESRETYVVEGLNRRDLLASLRLAQAQGRDIPGRGKPVARTAQDLSMRYELEPVEGGCRLKDLVVSLDVTIHLPEWAPQGTPTRGLRDDWSRMRDALERHEEGHRDIALESANYLLDGLNELGLHPDCQALRREAQKVFFRAQLRYSVRDGAYEHRTQHGIAQGAVL